MIALMLRRCQASCKANPGCCVVHLKPLLDGLCRACDVAQLGRQLRSQRQIPLLEGCVKLLRSSLMSWGCHREHGLLAPSLLHPARRACVQACSCCR